MDVDEVVGKARAGSQVEMIFSPRGAPGPLCSYFVLLSFVFTIRDGELWRLGEVDPDCRDAEIKTHSPQPRLVADRGEGSDSPLGSLGISS